MSGWSGEFKGSTDFVPGPRAWGSGGVGLIDALIDVVGDLDASVSLDRDEVLCLTSVGFKHYVYDPEYNPAYEPPRRVSQKACLFSNYGITESFGQHTGWEVMELNFIGAGDLAKLLAYEFASDRVVLTWASIDGESSPAWHAVVSVDASPARFIVELMDGVGERHEVDVTGRGGSLQGEGDEDLVNWCVVVRPGEHAPWALTLEKRRALVCRWGVKHTSGRKEFFHETRENYAVGLTAYQSLIGVVRQESLSDQERDVLVQHIKELSEGRRALAQRLPKWGEDFARTHEHGEEIEAAYVSAANHYEVAHAHLDLAAQCEVFDEACVVWLDLAHRAEQKAIEALAQHVDAL